MCEDSLDVIITDFDLPIFGGVLHNPFWRTDSKSVIIINSFEKFYEDAMLPFLIHETIHELISRLEDDDTSEKFDNLFPHLGESRCLIDGKMERHMLWRKLHHVSVPNIPDIGK